ncbi:MAG TPA: hypothetical protein VFX76_18535, partial [Roseiflexaceae bacterium]|nr:hypothetical protein [Roseiflexaceae bacterium]
MALGVDAGTERLHTAMSKHAMRAKRWVVVIALSVKISNIESVASRCGGRMSECLHYHARIGGSVVVPVIRLCDALSDGEEVLDNYLMCRLRHVVVTGYTH